MPWLARWVRNGPLGGRDTWAHLCMPGFWLWSSSESPESMQADMFVWPLCGFSWRNVIKCLFTPDLQIEHHCYTRKPKPKQNTIPSCLALYKALCGTCEFTRADFQEHNDSKIAPITRGPSPGVNCVPGLPAQLVGSSADGRLSSPQQCFQFG